MSFILVDLAQQSQLQLLSKSKDEKHISISCLKMSRLLKTVTEECGCVRRL